MEKTDSLVTRLDHTSSIQPVVLPTALQLEFIPNATYASSSYGDRGTEETRNSNITGPPGNNRCFSPLLLVGLALVLVASSTGNGTVLYIIGRRLKWRTATNVFITVLSLSDLVVSVTCVPLAMATVALERPALGETGCLVSSAVSNYFGLVSAGMTTMLTVDRYQAVVRLRRSTFTECRILAVIVAVTSASFLLVLPSMVLGAWRARHGRVTPGTVCLGSAVEWQPVEYRVYEALYATVCFTATAVCMVFCVFRLVTTIHRNNSSVCPHSTHFSQLRFVGEIETARTVVLMVILFVLFRAPHAVVAYLGSAAVTPSAAIVTQLLWWANGAVNPIVYAVRNPNVAKILKFDRKSGYVSEEPPAPCNKHFATGDGTSSFAAVCARSDSCRVSQTIKEQPRSTAVSTVTLRSTSFPSAFNFVTSRLAARNSVSSTSTTITNDAV